MSGVPLRRVTEYQAHASNAALKLFEVLAAAGVSNEDAEELVCAVEAGAIAGAQCVVVERTGCAGRERGEDFEAGWDAGVTVVCDDLVAIADRTYEQRGRAAPALQLLAHLRQRAQSKEAGGV
ncbi:hypothetical protein ACEZCY_35625 [Streptacidiphilus sp. N1-12]|uniref:Isochorismatase family protein n=1 Tax=Streptacidiphilus alkalitolerans TaxID=3342712 RepID=A0ABV6WR45_9ACTN